MYRLPEGLLSPSTVTGINYLVTGFGDRLSLKDRLLKVKTLADRCTSSKTAPVLPTDKEVEEACLSLMELCSSLFIPNVNPIDASDRLDKWRAKTVKTSSLVEVLQLFTDLSFFRQQLVDVVQVI